MPKHSTLLGASKESAAPEMVVNDESDVGGKDKKKNKNRKTQPKVEKSSNNQRRTDSESNAKKVSKGGGGSRNWGNDSEDARRANKGERDYDALDDVDNYEVELHEEPEPEPITFTLNEYMAQKAGEKKDEKLFGAVKERAVDGNVEGRRINDVGVDNYLVIGGLKENKQTREKKEKKTQVISVDFLSAPASQSVFRGERRNGNRPNDRDGRNGGRGGRGGYRIDANAFPSL